MSGDWVVDINEGMIDCHARTSCSRAVKRMRLRIAASASAAARRLMLPHPASPNATDVVQSCPNKSTAGLICNKTVDAETASLPSAVGTVEVLIAGVPLLGRCLADVIHSHSGTKVFLEQEVPALTRNVNGQAEHACMDLVFNINGSATYLDVSIVAPFS